MKFSGHVHPFGDHVDTDVILPGRFLGSTREEDLAKGCFAGLYDDFKTRVSRGDILIAGENFGCGSSREHAPLAIKAVGISCVVAASFSRIFFRSAINLGLPLLECPGLPKDIRGGERAEVDVMTGRIRVAGSELQGHGLPAIMLEILKAGGLVAFMSRRLCEAG